MIGYPRQGQQQQPSRSLTDSILYVDSRPRVWQVPGPGDPIIARGIALGKVLSNPSMVHVVTNEADNYSAKGFGF